MVKWLVGLPVSHEVPGLTPALATRIKRVKWPNVVCMPAMICAATHGQLLTHMLGVRVTWMQLTGSGVLHTRLTETSPISPGSLVSSASTTRIYWATWWPTYAKALPRCVSQHILACHREHANIIILSL